ncbi:MAG: HNH endonuclease [Clostridia bacterium]|nr:HNH endonuclease [Clostridia bacterium]MBQ8425766.1 HNH endonuclease [Clostridia bacterium]
MKEIWKDIEGYESLYQVSNLGNVKSLDHIRKNGTNEYMQKGKLLKPQLNNKTRYFYIRLSKNGKVKSFLLHRIIAQAFIVNPNNYKEINHKDENPSNNSLQNLEWCDRKYNINYGTGNQRRSQTEIGTKKGAKKVCQFDLKNNLLKIWDSQSQIKKELGMAQSNICNCCNGKRQSAYGYKWRYEKCMSIKIV